MKHQKKFISIYSHVGLILGFFKRKLPITNPSLMNHKCYGHKYALCDTSWLVLPAVGSGVPATEEGSNAAGPATAQGPAPGLAAQEVESA